MGLACGALNPSPLYSVELGQVVAGVVTLPRDLPMAIHDGRVFSMLIDTAAVLLSFGLDEGVVCRILSALMGGVSFLAIAAVAFAFTANRFAAMAAPILTIPLNIYIETHKYPIYYPVSPHDLGVNGLHFALLTLSLLVFHIRAGAVLVGLLPGIHASLAVPVWAITAIGMAFDSRKARELARAWPCVVGGMAAAGIAWTVHRYVGPSLPAGPADVDGRYAQAFITGWDFHRAPAGFAHVADLLRGLDIDALFIGMAGAVLVLRPRAWSASGSGSQDRLYAVAD
jgi:hypothetical protein